jgi:hypothetical protein
MSLQSETTEAGPVFHTEPAPVFGNKITPPLYPTTRQSAQAGNALVDVWLTNIKQQARASRDHSIALERAADARDPCAIEAHAQNVSTTAANIAGAIKEAASLGTPRRPSRELMAQAASEYHQTRGNRSTTNGDARTYEQVCADVEAYEREQASALRRPGRVSPATWRGVGDESNAKTSATRDAIKRAHPVEWTAGARAGFMQSQNYPADFSSWPVGRRNAWFSGFNQGLSDRMQQAERGDAA